MKKRITEPKEKLEQELLIYVNQQLFEKKYISKETYLKARDRILKK